MRPSFPIANLANSRRLNAEFLSYLLKNHSSSSQPSNFYHVAFFQFRKRASRSTQVGYATKNIESMSLILRWSYIFKILKAIIGAIPIFMIYLVEFWNRTNESSHNKVMDREFFFGFVPVKANTPIARLGSFKTTDSFHCICSAIHPRSYSANLTAIADFIKTFVTNYCSPVFHGMKYSMDKFPLREIHA